MRCVVQNKMADALQYSSFIFSVWCDAWWHQCMWHKTDNAIVLQQTLDGNADTLIYCCGVQILGMNYAYLLGL